MQPVYTIYMYMYTILGVDATTQKLIDDMSAPLEAIKSEVVGRSLVHMEGDPIQCRLRECNTGTTTGHVDNILNGFNCVYLDLNHYIDTNMVIFFNVKIHWYLEFSNFKNFMFFRRMLK